MHVANVEVCQKEEIRCEAKTQGLTREATEERKGNDFMLLLDPLIKEPASSSWISKSTDRLAQLAGANPEDRNEKRGSQRAVIHGTRGGYLWYRSVKPP